MKKVQCLIICGMKCGTTSIANALNPHPGIYLPQYEVNCFGKEYEYKKGILNYHQHFIRSKSEICGEKTASYLCREFGT